jgi:voltage-gated potassium channel
VGYGDLRPVNRTSRIVAILIATMGLTFTGIIGAVAVHAATFAAFPARVATGGSQSAYDL